MASTLSVEGLLETLWIYSMAAAVYGYTVDMVMKMSAKSLVQCIPRPHLQLVAAFVKELLEELLRALEAHEKAQKEEPMEAFVMVKDDLDEPNESIALVNMGEESPDEEFVLADGKLSIADSKVIDDEIDDFCNVVSLKD